MYNISKNVGKKVVQKSHILSKQAQSRAMASFDRSSQHYKLATHDPSVELSGHIQRVRPDNEAKYTATQLDSGVTVLTEQTIFPGPITMSLLLDVGTRDETKETSGACLALNNSYMNTLEQINSSGDKSLTHLGMDYDQEKIYFHGQCLEYDTSDMLNVMTEMAMAPGDVLDDGFSQAKNIESHEYANHLLEMDPFMNDTEALFSTAYGDRGLGMTRLGLKQNAETMTCDSLHQFLNDTVTPKK